MLKLVGWLNAFLIRMILYPNEPDVNECGIYTRDFLRKVLNDV